MIRWTEHKDCYRLDVSYRGRYWLSGCLAMSSGMGCLVVLIVFLQGSGPTTLETWLWMLFIAALFGAIAWSIVWYAFGHSRQEAWIEVSIRGGTARWGGPGSPETPTFIPVTRFEPTRSGGMAIDAVLPDGEQRRVMGPWAGVSHIDFARIVDGLNANLGTIESLAAPTSLAGSDLEAEPEIRRILETWSGISGPYRVELKDRDWLVICCLFLSLVAWWCWDAIQSGRPVSPWAFVVGAAFWFIGFYFYRYTPWVEVVSRGGAIRWGLGPRTICLEARARSIVAEPRGWSGNEYSWTLAGELADGRHVRLLGWPHRMQQRQALAFAYLLNWALRPNEPVPPPPGR